MIKKILLPLLCVFSIQAETELSGGIGGKTFEPSGNPYIIKSNESIVVPESVKTVIKPGCIFLFHPYSGLVVNGNLAVEGTIDSPVVFTSVCENQYTTDIVCNPDSS